MAAAARISARGVWARGNSSAVSDAVLYSFAARGTKSKFVTLCGEAQGFYTGWLSFR